ncbi:MAG: hypothetical protein ACLTMP_06575 [Eggerthella lenta]
MNESTPNFCCFAAEQGVLQVFDSNLKETSNASTPSAARGKPSSCWPKDTRSADLRRSARERHHGEGRHHRGAGSKLGFSGGRRTLPGRGGEVQRLPTQEARRRPTVCPSCARRRSRHLVRLC